MPAEIPKFIDQYCADCHDDEAMKGDLDLWSLAEKTITPETLQTWIKAYEHTQSGEMPPKKKKRPGKEHLDKFLEALADEIIETEGQMLAGTGRSIKRRLNRYEYENSVRDLLSLPYLEIKESLPEDPMLHGYNKIGEALDVSHVQLARYLRTAENALREAVVPVLERPDISPKRYYTWQQPGFRKGAGPPIRKTHPVVGLELRPELVGRIAKGKRIRPDVGAFSNPESREEEAVVLVASSYEPTDLQFNKFRAPVSGPYRLKFSGYTVWMSPGYNKVTRGRRTESVTIYSDTTPRILRRMGSFDFGPDPSVQEMLVWLKAGETIRPDATRLVRPRPTEYRNPLLEKDGMPGVAFQWMEVEGPLYDSWPPAGHKLLFGDLDLAIIEKKKSAGDFDPKHIYDPDGDRAELNKKTRAILKYAADVDDFLKVWKWGEWNTIKVRCEGRIPTLTTWVNGLKISVLDMSAIEWNNYDAEACAKMQGHKGHISLEVHNNNFKSGMGKDRWWPGAVVRWKNIYIRELN